MENSSGSISNVKTSGMLLLDAALQGNVAMLHELLQKDPLILHRPPPTSCTTTTAILLLHIACRLGHTEFASELLRSNPDLSNEVDPHDQSSTLHVAARNAHIDVVRCLVSTNPNLCFARDGRGMNPVHVAAISGHVDVLNVLAMAAPAAARERSMGLGVSVGDTLLHLCVKRNQLESVKLVVELMGDEAMMNAKDGDGNTVLHLATAQKHVEIIKFLLNDKRTQKNPLNSDGLTPLDLLTQQNHTIHSHSPHHNKDDEIYHLLKRAKAKHSKDVKIKTTKNLEKSKYFGSWIADHRNSLMVVASLIATMAFQAGINPPGSVWQDDSKDSMQSPSPTASSTTFLEQNPHIAGTSVLANHNNVTYDDFLVINTIGYFSSLSCILLLISGLPYERVTVVIVMVTMWFAVTCMAATYWISVLATMPYEINEMGTNILIYSLVGWLIMMILFVSGHILNAIVKLVILAVGFGRRLWRCCFGKKDDNVTLV